MLQRRPAVAIGQPDEPCVGESMAARRCDRVDKGKDCGRAKGAPRGIDQPSRQLSATGGGIHRDKAMVPLLHI